MTAGNVVRQLQPELTFCYTEYGLRKHPGLSGHIVARVVLQPDGSVEQTDFDKRVWSGDGGADVESCIREHITTWHFPPAAVGSAHDIVLSFSR